MISESRRRFMKSAGALVAGGAVVGCTADSGSEAIPDPESDVVAGSGPPNFPFRGNHQAGVTAPAASSGLVAGLDVRAASSEELADVLGTLGQSIEQLVSGEPYEDRDGGFPPLDTGILGTPPVGTGTSVVVGYGASLFDDRFGLAGQKPAELLEMPKFANDFLVQPERSHGDLSITISSDSGEATVHAFRQIMRETRGALVPRWMKEGFNQLVPEQTHGRAPARNLLGFKDGTSNLDTDDDETMAASVWVGPDDDQSQWTTGGTYQAVRVIRMMVEFWDRTRLNEQEGLIGRHRASGAPLGLDDETDEPVFEDLESHIARANPRSSGSEKNLILRRGFNYASGFDANDQLDQGLIFVSYQRSLEDGFIAVQRRLDGEALEEYVRPLGGGFFFVPPPPADGAALGEPLFS